MKATVAATVVLLILATAAGAQERYAVVVSGASGGEPYATRLNGWRQSLVSILQEKLAFPRDRLQVFCECAEGDPAGEPATRERVAAALEKMARVAGPQDLLFVVLLGHGSFDGLEARFNLVGPDLTASDWRDLVGPVRGRLVFVNTTGASSSFVERLSAPRRIVVSATETAAQRFDTIFPEYFIAALVDAAADLDKDGRVSILEAFSAASRQVKQHYERAGQLPTERALLDDNGDQAGKWAGGTGSDGATAARAFLDGERAGPAADPALAELLQKRAALEAQVDDLRARKPLMPPDQYALEFEHLMIDLARLSRDIRRAKS